MIGLSKRLINNNLNTFRIFINKVFNIHNRILYENSIPKYSRDFFKIGTSFLLYFVNKHM